MPCTSIAIRGLVLETTTREPIEGLRVEILGTRPGARAREVLGSAITTASGRFTIAAALPAGATGPERLHLELREPSGRAIDDVEGATSWSIDAPPDRLVLRVRVTEAFEHECPRPATLRRLYTQIQNYPSPSSGTLRVGGAPYLGTTARIVGTVSGADGAGLGNVRLRLTARGLGRTFTAPNGTVDYTGVVREFEVARAYTLPSAPDQGTYELVWPTQLMPGSDVWRGQGWSNNSPDNFAWNDVGLAAPCTLILRVEVPIASDQVNLSLAPSWSQAYLEVERTVIPIRALDEPSPRLLDFVLDALGTAAEAEFSRTSATLAGHEALFFRTSGPDAGTVNPEFTAADLVDLADRHDLDIDVVSAWLLAHKLAWELAGAANRSKNVLVGSPIALSAHQQIVTVERCYGLIRTGAPASTVDVAAMPLAEIRARLCAAVNRRLIADIPTATLDAFLDLALHVGVGVQLLNDAGVAITALTARENSRAAVLSASNPTPLSNPTGTATGAEARTLAIHRALLLVEELRRGELDGVPLSEREGLWSVDPAAPAYDPASPVRNAIWNLVRNNLRLTGGAIDTKGTFGAEASFFGRLADNSRLGHLLLGVSVAVGRFWTTAGPPTDPASLADFTLAAIEALASTSVAATLPDPFVIDGTPDFEAWAAEVQRTARRATWNRAIRGLLHDQPGLDGWADAELDGVDLRRARLRPSDFDVYADTENPALVLARRARTTVRRAKLAAPGDEAATVAALVAANIDSGRQAATMGRERFLGVMATAPDPAGAHAKATFNASAALALYTNRHPSAQGLGLAPSSALYFAPDAEDPDWDLHAIRRDGATSTTGLIGYAAYEPWRTIFSPLAYLAELLRWVEARGGYTGQLADRRPDLAWIHASEDATFAVVPYLTLALEEREPHARAQGSRLPSTSTRRTTRSTGRSERSAGPTTAATPRPTCSPPPTRARPRSRPCAGPSARRSIWRLRASPRTWIAPGSRAGAGCATCATSTATRRPRSTSTSRCSGSRLRSRPGSPRRSGRPRRRGPARSPT